MVSSQYDAGRAGRESLFFDTIATEERGEDVRSGSYEVITRAAIETFSEALAGSKVHLEIGSGAQPFSVLLPVDSRSVCVDVSFESLRVAKQRSPDLDYVCCDASVLPFRESAFDSIIGSAILHHLSAGVCAPELLRVRKPGAVAAFSEPQGGNPAIWIYRRLHPENYSEDECPLSDDDLSAWTAGATADVYRLDLFGIFPSLIPVLRGKPVIRKVVTWVDSMIEHRVPMLRRFFRYVIIVARKPGGS